MAATKEKTKISQINVYVKDGLVDAVGDGLLPDIADLNISGVTAARHIAVYEVEGALDKASLKRVGAELLADPVTQEFTIGEPPEALTHGAWVVHVKYNHGVTDAVGETAAKGIRDIGVQGATAVHTSKIYIIRGKVSKSDIDSICRRLLANSVIQSYSIEKR